MTLPDDALLPRVEDAPPSRLSPRVVKVWRLGALITTAAVTVAALVVLLAFEQSLLLAFPVTLAGIAEALLVPERRWRAWSYHVGEVDVRLTRGVLWRSTSVVLHSRIQHVDTSQGPLERAYGLARVVVYTAGSVGAVVSIPGLPAAEAEMLRDRLAALSGRDDAL
jgi:uncharacterized protein